MSRNELGKIIQPHMKKMCLISTEKTKRKSNYICVKCGREIIIGTKYMSVTYNDGFLQKNYGAFHLECWNDFLTDEYK